MISFECRINPFHGYGNMNILSKNSDVIQVRITLNPHPSNLLRFIYKLLFWEKK